MLRDHGISVAFGMPGIHNLPIYSSLYDLGIKTITVRHEQSASFMADGYARASGKPAGCAVIDGPGFLNAATGIAQAKGDSVPMIVLTPVGGQEAQGKLHELCGQGTISRQICKDHLCISSKTQSSEIATFLDKNFHNTRPGPLHIEIPLALMEAELSQSTEPESTAHEAVETMGDLQQAAKLLAQATSPIVIAGGGTIDAKQEVREFAEALDAPVVNTLNAKGILPRDHELRVGYSPSLPEIRNAIDESDVVVAIGTELSETDFDFLFLDKPLEFQRLVRIDIDQAQVTSNAIPDCPIVGDCKFVLPLVVLPAKSSQGAKRTARIRAQAANSPLNNREMRDFLDTIERETDVLVGDSTQPTYFATWLYEPGDVREYFASTTGFGTLGYAIPAAIGAKVACPSKRVTCLIGDGGSHYTLPEIQTAAQLSIGMPFVIWNNTGYAEIDKAMQLQSVDKWYHSPIPPNYRLLAEAYDVDYVRPDNVPHLAQTIGSAHRKTTPTIVDVVEQRFANSASTLNWFRPLDSMLGSAG